MELVGIVAALALLQYTFFLLRAAKSRGRHGIPAPAMTGHPDFERRLRVQENTLEQLIVFLPGLFLFAHFASEIGAVVLGGIFILGRALYARAYLVDPARRGPGFALTLGSNLILILGALAGAVISLL